MPKSKLRKKVKAQHAHEEQVHAVEVTNLREELVNVFWLVPTMVASFIIGLIWIVIFYVSQTRFPISGIGAWNMIIGFSFIAVGFSLATKWR
jgi:hypothetical protein